MHKINCSEVTGVNSMNGRNNYYSNKSKLTFIVFQGSQSTFLTHVFIQFSQFSEPGGILETEVQRVSVVTFTRNSR